MASQKMGGAKSIGIVGGGVTGLVAAYRLLQRGHLVRLFEASNVPGGLVRTFEAGGQPLECFYHHIFSSDTAAVRLIGELGQAETLEWYQSTSGIFTNGRIYPFTSARDLMRFSPLSLTGRLRLGLMALRLRRENDGSQFEYVTAAEWVRKNAGQRVLDAVWGPLLRGKFGDMADQVVMTWLWHKVRTRFSSRQGGRELLGYQRGSFAAWVTALAARIRELGGSIETARPVRRITEEQGRIALRLDGPDESVALDAVIATVANDAFLQISPALPATYREKLEATPFQDALCLVLALNRPFSRHYWLNVPDPDAPFVAIIEQTNLVEAARYSGLHIIYVSTYLNRESALLQVDAGDLFGHYSPHLKRINPSFDESWVEQRWRFHGRDAQPVFTAGAGSRTPAHRTPINNLYLANMSQIYPQDRGQEHSIRMGEKVAELVAADLARAETPHYQV